MRVGQLMQWTVGGTEISETTDADGHSTVVTTTAEEEENEACHATGTTKTLQKAV